MAEMQKTPSLPKIVSRKSGTSTQDLTMQRRVTFDASQLAQAMPGRRGSKEAAVGSSSSSRAGSKQSLLPAPGHSGSRQGSKQSSPTMGRTATEGSTVSRSGSTGAMRRATIEGRNPIDKVPEAPLSPHEEIHVGPWSPYVDPRKELKPKSCSSVIPSHQNLRDSWVKNLSAKYQLDTIEVRQVLDCLDKAQKQSAGRLDVKQFREAMCAIFERDDLKEVVVCSAWLATTGKEADGLVAVDSVDVEEFLKWYVGNMFAGVAALCASKESQESEELLNRLAKKFSISAYTMDKVKRRFMDYDTDGSGLIEYEEFVGMMCKILRVEKKGDLSEDRLERFWKEIDVDSSGEVDLEEFTEWYLKYFNPEAEDNLGPAQAFYASFNPDTSRRNTVQAC